MIDEISFAGYNDQGNDRNGHFHIHPCGPDIRHDGARGFFCVAPTDMDFCTDPHTSKMLEHAHAFLNQLPSFSYLTTFAQGMLAGAFLEDRDIFKKDWHEVTFTDLKLAVRTMCDFVSAYGVEK